MASASEGVCRHCLRRTFGHSCKRRDCEGYADRYLGDQAQRIKSNLAAWDGKVTMVTLTGPGVDELPWDPSRCRSKGPHRHAGPLGCQVNPIAAASYNAQVVSKLGALNDAARERVRRRHPGATVTVLAYVGQIKRGVFHVHVVLGYRTSKDRAALSTWIGTYSERRESYGFGVQWDPGNPGKFNGRQASAYVSKYITRGMGEAFVMALRLAAMMSGRSEETGRKPQLRPIYVSPALTRRTGVTMRFLRFKRWLYRCWGPVDLDVQLWAYNAYRILGAIPEALQVPEVERKPVMPF